MLSMKTGLNFLIITRWNEENQEIDGVLNVNFLFLEDGHVTPEAPDSITFVGKFFTKIVE